MVKQVEKYYTTLLSVTEIRKAPIHNLEHSQEVVKNMEHITTAINTNSNDKGLLHMAS
ncbi:hypothetical protein [Patiriisocius sp. Uisw_017]|jgi:hypothetical protein|uniref:hypothetical protein n=1 Tax=Patiriisocius sp. Uisw_017 TaxID=3230968 RepID=UPI0039E7AD78